MAFEVIKNLFRGYFATIGDNELTVVSTMQDPPKIRLAVEANKIESNLGSICFNQQRVGVPDTQDEMAYIMGRMTANKIGGAIYFAVAPHKDANCQQVFYIDNGRAIFNVPVDMPAGSGQASNKIVSMNGRYVTVQQDDGNFVTYDLNLGPEGDPNAAVWSAWSGKIER